MIDLGRSFEQEADACKRPIPCSGKEAPCRVHCCARAHELTNMANVATQARQPQRLPHIIDRIFRCHHRAGIVAPAALAFAVMIRGRWSSGHCHRLIEIHRVLNPFEADRLQHTHQSISIVEERVEGVVGRHAPHSLADVHDSLRQCTGQLFITQEGGMRKGTEGRRPAEEELLAPAVIALHGG